MGDTKGESSGLHGKGNRVDRAADRLSPTAVGVRGVATKMAIQIPAADRAATHKNNKAHREREGLVM